MMARGWKNYGLGDYDRLKMGVYLCSLMMRLYLKR